MVVNEYMTEVWYIEKRQANARAILVICGQRSVVSAIKRSGSGQSKWSILKIKSIIKRQISFEASTHGHVHLIISLDKYMAARRKLSKNVAYYNVGCAAAISCVVFEAINVFRIITPDSNGMALWQPRKHQSFYRENKSWRGPGSKKSIKMLARPLS